ncbi:C2H2 type zinc finger domain-containing protein, partial [Metarhizium hybridum]
MTTAAQQHQQLQNQQAAETFDPDEVLLRGSPLMKALHPKLELSPSPPPDIPPAQVSLSPPPIDGFPRSNRPKIRPSSGDAVLVAYLDNGRRPEIARAAGYRALPGADDEEEDGLLGDPSSPRRVGESPVYARASGGVPQSLGAMTSPRLQHLAADALQAVTTDPVRASVPRETPDIAFSTRHLSISDDRPHNTTYHLASRNPSKQNATTNSANKSPITMLTPASGGLPPLQMDSPKSECNGHILPSIRSTLGDINRIPSEPPTPADKDMPTLHGSSAHFSRSPPGTMRRLPPMSAPHVSPPISPNEPYQLSLPSPRSLPASSPYSGYTSNGLNHRPNTEYVPSACGETPSTDQSALTPSTTTSVVDRMSIDGITNPPVGLYACNFAGCTAQPFQTQYLLNSHANVHSSARPHYCPVQGCPRSEGGKGFKRKNEMIRHGLVHDSPGYVCPFCPEREHKYPRPDNLQRYGTFNLPKYEETILM